MANKTAFFEKKILQRTFRKTKTAVSGANASQTNITVTSSAGFDPGDFVSFSADATHHYRVQSIPDGTHITLVNATAALINSGTIQADAYSPLAIFLCLFTAAPTDAGGGTEVSTVGTGYAPIQITQDDANWTAPSGTPSSIASATAETFGVPTTTAYTAVAFGYRDAVAGNLLEWNMLNAPKTVNVSDPAPQFASGSLTDSED